MHRQTVSIEPTKDKWLCSIKVEREKDAKLAQKLGQLQPFVPAFPQECMGQLAVYIVWADLTPLALQPGVR